MGIFGKLFGKKSADFSIPEMPAEIGYDDERFGSWSNPMTPEEETPMEPQIGSRRAAEMEQYHVPEVHRPSGIVSGERYDGMISPKDVQLILTKLDVIASRLENLNRRLEAFEATRKVERNLW